MPRASRITVSLPAPLLAFVDDYASRHEMNRSEVIVQAVQAFQARLIDAATGSLARDDGRDMTQELLDERRAKAQNKGW
jgi:Arc/MetJ-type ribon-helix-helix transcriptional regulator